MQKKFWQPKLLESNENACNATFCTYHQHRQPNCYFQTPNLRIFSYALCSSMLKTFSKRQKMKVFPPHAHTFCWHFIVRKIFSTQFWFSHQKYTPTIFWQIHSISERWIFGGIFSALHIKMPGRIPFHRRLTNNKMVWVEPKSLTPMYANINLQFIQHYIHTDRRSHTHTHAHTQFTEIHPLRWFIVECNVTPTTASNS